MLKTIFAALIFFLIAFKGQALAAQYSLDETADLATEALKATGDVKAVIRKTPDTLLVTLGGDKEMTVFLNNLVLELNADPKQERAILSQFAKVFAQSAAFTDPTSTKELRLSLMPAVRNANSMAEALRAAGGDESRANDYVKNRVAADYIALLAIDRPDAVTIPGRESFAGLGLDDQQMFEIAIKNLETRMVDVQVERDGGVSMVVLDGYYESSILLVESFWRRERESLKDDIVAVAPARDLLLFCPASNTDCVRTIDSIATQNFDSLTHSISVELIKWNGTRWVDFPK